jgi:hypothetical protein
MIKSRKMRWSGHVACMGERRNGYRILVGKPEGKRPLGRRRCEWKDNLRWTLEKWNGVALTELMWLRIGISGGLL